MKEQKEKKIQVLTWASLKLHNEERCLRKITYLIDEKEAGDLRGVLKDSKMKSLGSRVQKETCH